MTGTRTPDIWYIAHTRDVIYSSPWLFWTHRNGLYWPKFSLWNFERKKKKHDTFLLTVERSWENRHPYSEGIALLSILFSLVYLFIPLSSAILGWFFLEPFSSVHWSMGSSYEMWVSFLLPLLRKDTLRVTSSRELAKSTKRKVRDDCSLSKSMGLLRAILPLEKVLQGMKKGTRGNRRNWPIDWLV